MSSITHFSAVGGAEKIYVYAVIDGVIWHRVDAACGDTVEVGEWEKNPLPVPVTYYTCTDKFECVSETDPDEAIRKSLEMLLDDGVQFGDLPEESLTLFSWIETAILAPDGGWELSEGVTREIDVRDWLRDNGLRERSGSGDD